MDQLNKLNFLHHRNEFVQAKEQLDEIGIPYQTLEQEESESLRITESSGISFIFTLKSKPF